MPPTWSGWPPLRCRRPSARYWPGSAPTRRPRSRRCPVGADWRATASTLGEGTAAVWLLPAAAAAPPRRGATLTLREALEQSSGLLALLSPEGVLQDCNAALLNTTGLPRTLSDAALNGTAHNDPCGSAYTR